LSKKKQPPKMEDYGLKSYHGNAPEWSEQGKKQKKFLEALKKYEKEKNE